MKMNKIFIVVMTLCLFSSCGVYKYTYDADSHLVISRKKNPITQVRIKNEKGELLVLFTAIDNGRDTFSLLDFSPEFYSSSVKDFKYGSNKKYLISISPQGDKLLQDIILLTDSLGQIK